MKEEKTLLEILAQQPLQKLTLYGVIASIGAAAVAISHEPRGPWFHDDAHLEQSSTSTGSVSIDAATWLVSSPAPVFRRIRGRYGWGTAASALPT
jgi:hypothetical protein